MSLKRLLGCALVLALVAPAAASAASPPRVENADSAIVVDASDGAVMFRKKPDERRAYVRSHSALLSVIQALAYAIYALDEPAYADRIKAFRLK